MSIPPPKRIIAIKIEITITDSPPERDEQPAVRRVDDPKALVPSEQLPLFDRSALSGPPRGELRLVTSMTIEEADEVWAAVRDDDAYFFLLPGECFGRDDEDGDEGRGRGR